MSEYDSPDFFDPVDEINRILSDDRQALPSVYKKLERLDVVGEGSALVASANKRTLPTRRVGRFEMLEVLERSLSRTVLNIANPGQRVFTAIRELSDFVNMATTGAQPKISNAHRDLLPVGHPLSTKQHNFSTEEVAQAHAEWMSADPRIAEEFRPLVASAFVAPASSIEREYVIAKLEATSSTEVPRDIILGLTADADPYGGGNSFLARSARAKAQRRDRKGRFAYMGGGAKIWLGKQFSARSTLFRFAGYDSKTDSFDLEGLPNTPYQGKVVSVPASKVEAIKAILPELPGLKAPASKSVAKDIIVDPSSLTLKDAPIGWTKVSSENGVDTFRSADGWIATRYPNSASAPNEPSITRVRGANVDKSIDPDLPVYHIAKGSNDGLVTDKPFASTQSWGDTQALISRYDKKTNPKPKATLEEQPEEFLEGWTKGEGGYIPGKSNSYTEVSDRAGGKDFYTDPSGRYVAVKLATPPATWQIGAEQYKQTEDERTRKQVLESGLPIETFDGAQKWDGNVDNLYRLERVKSDGKRELLGFYQDPDDIEKDTEIPLTEDKSQDFYESVIADTLQNGGNTIDFVDGNWPEDGYIVAHEADILKQDGTLGKREELVTPEDFADPIEGPKRLRDFVLKNQDKLNQQGFYLGTWLDTVPVKDENGTVVGEREMVFLDVSEYEADFDKAFDKAEARKEIAIYGVATYDKEGNKGTSLYVADEKRRREIVRKTPVFDKEEARRVSDEADRIIREEDKWFSDNNLEVQKTGRTFWVGSGDDAIPNPELEKDYPEIYRRLKRRFDAEKSRRSVFQNYIRSIFDMSDGMDPGGRNDGLSGESLRTRDNYVGRDRQTLEMNKALRDGGEVTSKVQKMDTLVKKSKVKDDTQFFRGAWLDPELVKDMGVGDMFFDRAFQSMGLEEATASSYLDFREKDFPNKSRTIFRLLLPKGMNAIHVGDDEVIARRNTKMRIIRKSELDGTTYFDVDVEPQTKEEIDARIQGRVPRPEPSESSSELPANDGGGADGLGDGGTPPVNYSPESTVEGPDSERVTDPRKVIWDNLLEDVGIAEEDVIEEAINMMDSPERTARQMLKDQVATSLKEKLADVSDQEFVDLSLSGLSEFMDKKDFGFDGTRSIDFIGVIEMRKRKGRNIGRYTTIESLVTNGAVPRNFPKDLVDRLNTGKITRKDAEEVVRLLNEFRSSPPLPNEDKLYIPSVDDKEFMDYLRYKTISGLVGAWSSSSNGTNPLSLAIQDLAMKEFDIKSPAEWRVSNNTLNDIENIKTKNSNLIRRFLRAQYELTQEYFQKKGISKVTLYRGIKEFIRHDIKDATFPSENGFVGSIKLRPLSSWTTSIGVANRFRNIDNGKMFRKEFDVKDIFSTPGTGVGCLPEEELVTLGGIVRGVDVSADYKVEQLRVVFPSPEPQPITYKEDQPKINISNAPLLLGDFRDLTDEERAEIRRHNPATAIWVPIAEESTFYGKEIPSTLVNVLEQDKEAVRIGKLGGTLLGEEATIGLSRALKSGVAENLTEKLKDISDKEFIDLAMAQGKKEINAGDKSAVESLRYQVVSDLIKSWAVTSNGDEPMSLAVQEIAKKEFGVETASNWDIDPEKQKQVDDIVKNNANLIRKFLRAQYDATQEYFKRKGITKLSLFRGVKKFDNHEMIEATFPNNGMFTATLGLRPLSSWSTSRNVAEIFANFHQQSRLFRKEFDVKDILCFPGTGFGCLDEKEMVVIGGNTKSIDVSSARLLNPIRGVGQTPFSFEKESENYQIVFKDDKKNPLEEPTEAGRPIGNWVNYAPVDLSKIPPDDGGDEPDPDEINIFDLENPDYSAPGFYKFEIAKNLAETDEMREVSDSEMVDLSDWFGLFSTDDLDWGEDEKKEVGSIKLLSLDQSEFGEGEWGGEYEFTDLLYDIEQNIRFGGVEPFKKGSVLKRVMDGYIDGEDPSISKEELAQFFKDYSKHFDEDITDSYLIPSIEDEQFMRLLREEVASNLVNVWAETSNGDHPMSHAIQDIAKTVLGVKDSADWEDGKTQDQKDELFNAALDVKENYGEALRAFVKAQYRLTQEWLEERGIEKLVVYRGIKEPNGVDNKKGLVQLRPLSSWSQSQRTALKFTGGTPNPTGGMLKTVIDAKDVFSTPFTGFGCLEEDEIVVIGGKKPAEMRPVKDVWDGWTEGSKAQNDIPVSNAPMSNFAPKKGKGGLSKEIERRQRLAQQQQEEYAKRLEEQEKAKENIKGQVEANKEELERQIPQIAQSLPTTIDDLFDPNYPLNVLNSRDITQEVFGATNSSDIRRPSAVAALEPDQNWKDLIKNLESLGLADAQDIENEVNSKFNASLSDIRRKRKNASESRKTLENALVSVEGKLKAVEDELILNNFGLDRPQSDPATTQGIADVKKRVSDLRAWAEEYYHQKTGQAVDAFSTPSPLFRLVSVFHGQNERSEEIMQGAVSQLSEIGKLQDSRERQKGYDRVIAKIILGTYMLPYSSSFRQSLENLKTSPAVETLLGRKIPALVIDSALNDLKKKFIQLSEDSSKEEQAVKDLSYEVSKIIKEKLTALGVRFKHNVEISASDINYLGTGEIDINALVAGKPKSEWFKRYNTGEIAPHLSTAQSMAAVLTEALQAFPEPVALVIKKFIVEHPEIMFAGGKRGFWSHTPKDRNIDKVQYVDPADEYMSLTLDGRTKERSVNTASHELTHLLVTQILPQLQPVEWAVLSSFVNQYDADGNIKHDLINGNGGDILIGGEISTTSARDASGLAYRAEASVYTPKVASPYSTKYQIFGNIPGLRVNGTTGLMPYGHGEFLSTLTESMFNGSNQVFYGQRGVSPGDRVRIGYNADGTVKYFTIPDSPIFNAGALPVGIAISLLMNQLAKDKLEVI